MTVSKVLVLGASGTVASIVVTGLRARGIAVKAASRSGKGEGGVVFDYADLSTHAAALDGVDGVFALIPTGSADPVGLAAPFLRVAAARNVRIVLMTAMGIGDDDTNPYRQLEKLVASSGAPFVVLRPNWFADNFQSFWAHGVKTGVVAVPAAAAATSFIDARDIAASAVGALTSTAHDGRFFDLTGPEALTYGQATEVLSTVLGRPIRYQAIDDETFIGHLVGAGVPAPYAGFLASIFVPVRAGSTAVVTDSVKTLTGQAPRALSTYATDRAALLNA